jgi:hypothetical protein
VSRPRITRRWVVAGIVLFVFAAGAIVIGVLWSSRGPDAASVDEALENFRDEPGDDASGGSAPLVPAAGVYTYRGSGSERLSFLGTSQPQGPVLPATVRHEPGGCWTFTIEYSTHHQETWRYCVREDGLEELGGEVRQRFEFVGFSVEEMYDITCHDAFALRVDAAAGDSWGRPCRESDDSGTVARFRGEYQFLGTEPIRVGGDPVRAYHYREHRLISGDQSGTTTVDAWFSVSNGLPLRNERVIEVATPSPIGDVTYSETGEWGLTSLEPQT